MKKIGLVLGLMVAGVAAFAKPAVPVDTIPQPAKDFIAKNFAGNTAAYAERGNKSWEVVLDDGTEIEFTAAGEWNDIESYTNIPASVLPKAVADKIASEYAGQSIRKVEKERGVYKVKFENRRTIRISENGTILNQKDFDAKSGASKRKTGMVKPVQPRPMPQPKAKPMQPARPNGNARPQSR